MDQFAGWMQEYSTATLSTQLEEISGYGKRIRYGVLFPNIKYIKYYQVESHCRIIRLNDNSPRPGSIVAPIALLLCCCLLLPDTCIISCMHGSYPLFRNAVWTQSQSVTLPFAIRAVDFYSTEFSCTPLNDASTAWWCIWERSVSLIDYHVWFRLPAWRPGFPPNHSFGVFVTW